MNGFPIVCGGWGDGTRLQDCEIYNMDTGEWEADGAFMLTKRYRASSVMIDEDTWWITGE